MAQITIMVIAEAAEWEADAVTQDFVESLERLAPYVFDNVVVTSQIQDDDGMSIAERDRADWNDNAE